jgi:hemolysin activation/secretion protein
VLLAQDIKKEKIYFIGVIKIPVANYRTKPSLKNKYIKGQYKKGTLLELESCDKYGWCKIKDKDLYISKFVLGFMKLNNNPFVEIKKTSNNRIVPKVNITQKIKSLPRKCIKLKKIELNENSIFTKNDQIKALLKFQNNCIDGKVLKQILTDISQYYMNNGYITTKPYLEEQDISDGQIDIKVVTGIIENIIDSKIKENTWNIKTAFASQQNKPLNLRDLETSLEMVNRVPSVDAKFDIKPGSSNGASIVEVNNKVDTPYHLRLGIAGEKSFRDNDPDLTATVSYDNLLNINDIISFTYNGSRIQEEYQSTSGYEYNYSFPIGSYLFELIYSDTKYRQGIVGINDTYLSNGITIGNKLKISKVLTRNQKHKLELAATIYHKDSKTYFENELIEVSSYKTTLAQLDLTHTYLKNWGQFISTYSYYEGKNWFGSRDDRYNNAEIDSTSEATLEFKKYSVSTSLLYYFTDRSYKFDNTFYLQHTNDLLYNNDQLTVGSDYTVRGYDDSNLFGNNGHYFKNNITKTFTPKLNKKYLETISIFAGLDYGHVRCESDNESSCGEIYGTALGFQTSADTISSDFTWSKAHKNIGTNSRKENRFTYKVTIEF